MPLEKSTVRNVLQKINLAVGLIFVFIIRGYQIVISPLFPPSCRFYPSCSSYSIEALRKYGIIKGGALGVWRVLRCNPFNPGGNDPVP